MSEPFCSRLAQAGHGVIPGTGVRADIYLFLPVDKKRWGSREFNDSWASPAELEAIRRARTAGVVSRLYDPPAGAAKPAVLVHAAPSPSPRAAAALQALLSDLGGQSWEVDEGGAPRLALCTQGTRDRCCAKWGFAVYRAARKLHDAGGLPFQPIECSHLGGDRFAATGIVFPSGSMYGHLDKIGLADLAAAEAEQRILQGHYRGRVFESPLAQVVRAGLARDGFPVTTVSGLTIETPEAAPAPLKVAASGRSYEVILAREEIRFFGDCEAAARNRMSRETRLTYVSGAPAADA